MTLFIGDNIYSVFEKYKISKSEILDTFNFPNSVQSLECNVTLYSKIQNIDERTTLKKVRHYFICTKKKKYIFDPIRPPYYLLKTKLHCKHMIHKGVTIFDIVPSGLPPVGG